MAIPLSYSASHFEMVSLRFFQFYFQNLHYLIRRCQFFSMLIDRLDPQHLLRTPTHPPTSLTHMFVCIITISSLSLVFQSVFCVMCLYYHSSPHTVDAAILPSSSQVSFPRFRLLDRCVSIPAKWLRYQTKSSEVCTLLPFPHGNLSHILIYNSRDHLAYTTPTLCIFPIQICQG